MSNIYQIQLLYPCFVLLTRQDFSKAIGSHFGRRDPLNVDLFVLDLLSKPVLIDVNMLKLGVKLWCILS